MHETLAKYADDTKLAIQEIKNCSITISAKIPSRGNEIWTIKSDDLVHLDMSPFVTLGKIEFGDLSLLPEGYFEIRNFDYNDELARYRVLKITDNCEKVGYLVLFGEEKIERNG